MTVVHYFNLNLSFFYRPSVMGLVFVSPELSSGRDLVIQMSVRRPPSMVFCPEHILGSV